MWVLAGTGVGGKLWSGASVPAQGKDAPCRRRDWCSLRRDQSVGGQGCIPVGISWSDANLLSLQPSVLATAAGCGCSTRKGWQRFSCGGEWGKTAAWGSVSVPA